MGINEDQDLLQISPTDTALELTQSTPVVPGAPKSYYEEFGTYNRTFARVVPSDAAEARAQVQEMRALGVKKLYVTDDASDYGRAIAYALRLDAGSSIAAQTGPPTAAGFSSSGADALFFGASARSAPAVASLFTQIATANPKSKLFAPSALSDAAFAASLGTIKAGVYVSAPGFLPKNLPLSAQTQFVKPFESAYGHAPATEAIFGYEAMSALLAVLHQAGTHGGDRSRVVHDFFSIRNRASVLGTYSIDSGGDTSIAPFVFSRVAKGALVPDKFLAPSS
jgi:ABC-type branched-subunit amino acid transport system substrate-binding protein